MSKVGKIFKNLFKVVFICGALFFGLISICTMFAPFLSSSIDNGIGSIVSGVSGFDLAFGGKVTIVTTIGSNQITSYSSPFNFNAGILSAFILLALALVLALIFLIYAWGKKGAKIKKFFALGSSLCFLTAGILFFCVKPLTNTLTAVNSLEISAGAITTGVLCVFSSICSLVATALGPSNN